MKLFIYVNKAKDEQKIYTNKIISVLESKNIDYEFVDGSVYDVKGDGLIVVGGDGTILKLNKFANHNSLPVICINAGTLGFLSEFEFSDIEDVINQFVDGSLRKDPRTNICVETDGKQYTALNEAVIQRVFSVKDAGIVAKLSVSIDDNEIEDIIGDGVIVSTPTGSTAYSLSAGGAVLAPGIDAFEITPIAPHSFSNRPIIYSSKQPCTVKNLGENNTALFIDGRFVGNIKKGQIITIKKAEKDTLFLRKKDTDFYDRLVLKLNRGAKSL